MRVFHGRVYDADIPRRRVRGGRCRRRLGYANVVAEMLSKASQTVMSFGGAQAAGSPPSLTPPATNWIPITTSATATAATDAALRLEMPSKDRTCAGTATCANDPSASRAHAVWFS